MKNNKITSFISLLILTLLVLSCDTRNVYRETETILNTNFSKSNNINFITGVIATEEFNDTIYKYSIKEIDSSEIDINLISKTEKVHTKNLEKLLDQVAFKKRLVSNLKCQDCLFSQIYIDSLDYKIIILK